MFFQQPRTLFFLLFLIFPIYGCTVFVSYSVPLIGNEWELTTTAISALIMLNSLISGYCSPPMTRLCVEKLGVKRGVFLYLSATAGAIALFAALDSVWALVAALVVLGLAESFGLVALLEEFYRLNGGQSDAAGAMTVVTMVGKAGQSAAPLIISAAGSLGTSRSCAALSALVAAGMALYGIWLWVEAGRRPPHTCRS